MPTITLLLILYFSFLSFLFSLLSFTPFLTCFSLVLSLLFSFPLRPFSSHCPSVDQLTPFPCCTIVSAMLSFDFCLLGLFWAYCTLSFGSVPIAQYYHWTWTHVVLGFLGPFHPFGASLVHFIPLGILGLFHFLGHPWSILILHSHRLLLNLLGFFGPNFHILYFLGLLAFLPTPFTNSFLWAPLAHFYLLSIFHNSHRFTTFFGLPWACFLLLGPFEYLTGPWTIIPTIRV